MVGFRDLVGTSIAPVSKKAAVKVFFLVPFFLSVLCGQFRTFPFLLVMHWVNFVATEILFDFFFHQYFCRNGRERNHWYNNSLYVSN